MARIFALDTTSKYASIAIFDGDQIALEYNFTAHDTLSATLIPAVKWTLNSLGLKPADIDVYGIAIGPGLFTGIRVGLSALKGILFQMDKPVVPVSNLEALATKHLEKGITLAPMIDARREEIYISAYQHSLQHSSQESPFREIVAPCLLPVRELHRVKESLPPQEERELHFIGSGAEVYMDRIKDVFPHAKTWKRSPFLAPEIGQITAREFSRGNYLTDLQDLMPLYIRKPDAEVNYRPPQEKKK